jgi:hypothetical protein
MESVNQFAIRTVGNKIPKANVSNVDRLLRLTGGSYAVSVIF